MRGSRKFRQGVPEIFSVVIKVFTEGRTDLPQEARGLIAF